MIENELKYVLSLEAAKHIEQLHYLNFSDILQGYDKGGARFRSANNKKYTFNYKVRIAGVIDEFELPINKEEFTRCYANCNEKLHKHRYTAIDKYSNTWDIDLFYYGIELYFVLAECELSNEEKAFPEELLPFVANHLIFEVPRNDNRFTSRKLSNLEYARKLLRSIS